PHEIDGAPSSLEWYPGEGAGSGAANSSLNASNADVIRRSGIRFGERGVLSGAHLRRSGRGTGAVAAARVRLRGGERARKHEQSESECRENAGHGKSFLPSSPLVSRDPQLRLTGRRILVIYFTRVGDFSDPKPGRSTCEWPPLVFSLHGPP